MKREHRTPATVNQHNVYAFVRGFRVRIVSHQLELDELMIPRAAEDLANRLAGLVPYTVIRGIRIAAARARANEAKGNAT